MTDSVAEEEIVDAEVVESKTPRLSMSSLGGLSINRPQESIKWLNLMVYGDSGAGKTLLAGTSAFVEELSPVLFVDVEGGTLSLSHFDDTADIDVVRVENWKDMQKVYDELYKGRHPYKTVVIDSLTEVQKMAMSSVLNGGDNKSIEAVGNLPEFKEWHINTEQMRRLVRAFRDLPINTIFTCLAMDQKDPRRESVFIKKPNLTKKLADEIPAFFDILFYLYVKEQKDGNLRLMQTDKSDRVVAKCRVQGVPLLLQNPTMESLYDMLIRNPLPPGEAPVSMVQTAQSGGMKRKR